MKSYFKPIVLMLAPRFYYKRLIKQAIQEMNVNSPYVSAAISIPYNPVGKYPTMYDNPPKFYEKRKRTMEYDENGIPMLSIDGNVVYHPVYMIQYALSEYGFFMSTHDISYFETAKKISEWLIDRQDVDNGCWYYSYDYVHEPTQCLLKAPWASAMAQGQAISLLTRMYHATKDKKYLLAAMKATTILDVPISSGGLASELWGHTIYEEFPTIPYSITLNGFMFCVLGLYDLSQTIEDKRVTKLWNEAKDAIMFMVPLYDGDIMSTYCLSHVTMGNIKRYWAGAYHSIHIIMLQCFESFMPSTTFEFYIKRWAGFWGIEINE